MSAKNASFIVPYLLIVDKKLLSHPIELPIKPDIVVEAVEGVFIKRTQIVDQVTEGDGYHKKYQNII